VTGEWRKLHSEELHSLYTSPDFIRQVKLRQMRWAVRTSEMSVSFNIPEDSKLHTRHRDNLKYHIKLINFHADFFLNCILMSYCLSLKFLGFSPRGF
jgi:hypothetical protein